MTPLDAIALSICAYLWGAYVAHRCRLKQWQVIHYQATPTTGHRYRSMPMDWITANTYASIFGGDVVYYERRPAFAKL